MTRWQRFDQWRSRRRFAIRRAVAYVARVLLGSCPHEWQTDYEAISYRRNPGDPLPQTCIWCGLQSQGGRL